MVVSIVNTDRARDVRRAVELLGGMERFISSGEKVVVKPNICTGKESSTGAVTDPEMVAEVCRMVRECGAEPVVAESPIYVLKSPQVFKRAGYGDFESRYGFPLVDIDADESRDIRIPGGRAISHAVVSNTVLTCDKLINMPVLKTHLEAVVTLGLKNLKGVVLGKQKHLIHLQGLDQGIVDLNKLIKSDLTIIDGIIGMDGYGGPTMGNAVKMGVIVAGDNVVETDSVAVRIIGGDPRDVKHIRLAAEQGLGSLDGFEMAGESLKSVSRRRVIPRAPGFFRFFTSNVGLRAWYAVLNPVRRLTGGERVVEKVLLGDLVIDNGLCDGCRLCMPACPVDALSFGEMLVCDRKACIRCFCCAEVCPSGALTKKLELGAG